MTRLSFGIGDFVASLKGEAEGHPFRGNQYGGSGAGGESLGGGSKASRQYEKTTEGRNKKLSDIAEGDTITHGGKDWDVLAVNRIGGKQNRHDVIVKPQGEPRRKTVQGVGLNKGKTLEVDQSRALTMYNTGGAYSADNFSFK